MLTKDRISGLFFLAVSIAYGAFAFDRCGEPQDVLEAADRAMYEHKRQNAAPTTPQRGEADN